MNNKSTRIAFIGLGTMGYPIAGHLSQAGFDLCVYNRTRSKAEAWLNQFSGQLANTPAEAAKMANIIILCVSADEDVWQICCGPADSLLESQSKHPKPQDTYPKPIVIDHSSISAKMTRSVANELQKHDIQFIDAPISGGQSGAQDAQLTIMCGGEQQIFNQLAPLFSCYAKTFQLIGPTGSGQLCKMVNQICVAGVLQGLAEGIHFAEQAGLNLNKVFTAIEEGAAASWQMKHRNQTMAKKEYDFGFAVDLFRKDLANCLQAAHETQANLPTTALIDQFYSNVQAQGGGRWDTSSLIEALRGSPT